MHRRFRRAYTVLVEHGCVGYAKLATVAGFVDLDLIIAKATSPDDIPTPERYIWELTKVFSLSPSSTRAFSLSFTRRFGKTRCWRVALKCLMLLHRLLRSLPENHPFRADLLWSRANVLISLYPCHFRDKSSSASDDFTLFVRSYAHLLDEAIDCYHSIAGEIYDPPPSESFPSKMKDVGRALELLPQLLSLMDRAMECDPTGAASRSFLVRLAMKQIIRDSFICYAAVQRDLTLVLDNLLQMQHRSCIAGLRIYKRAAEQAKRLDHFYDSCKIMGLCGVYEYPVVEKIPTVQVLLLESFVNHMWQLTDSSSLTSPSSSRSTLTDVEGDGQVVASEKAVISVEWERFEESSEEEEEPLIQLEDDETSWEILLEASIRHPWAPQNLFYPWMDTQRDAEGRLCERDELMKLQVYNPYPFNPFHGGFAANSSGINSVCSWGL